MKKKVFSIIGISLAALVVLTVAASAVVWREELKTLTSIKEIMKSDGEHNGNVYEIKVEGDYYLDDYVASGGAASDKELISFLTKKITRGFFNLKIEESTIGCSSFSAHAENGDAIFGRNYDMSRTNVALVHTKPRNRYHSISTVDLTFIGVDSNGKVKGLGDKFNMLAAPYVTLDGMNEKGLAVGIYMTFQGPAKQDIPTDQQTAKPDVTSTVLLRLMLDHAATVEEAVAIAERYDMHDSASSSFHYMVSDASGKSAVLEYIHATDEFDTDGSKRELKVIYKDDPASLAGSDKYQILTNFIVYPGYYNEGDTMHGLDRYETMKSALVERDGFLRDEADAMSILSAVAMRDPSNVIRSVTVHSIVFNQTKKTMEWVSNRHYGEDKYTYTFNF